MDPIQVFGSLAAIMVTAFIAARMFPVKNPLDDTRVRNNIVRFEADAVIAEILIADGGNAALAKLDAPAESIGLTVQLGDRVVCRILRASDIKRAEAKDGKLIIRLDDFTQPNVTLPFADKDKLTAARDLVNSVAIKSPTEKDVSHAA